MVTEEKKNKKSSARKKGGRVGEPKCQTQVSAAWRCTLLCKKSFSRKLYSQTTSFTLNAVFQEFELTEEKSSSSFSCSLPGSVYATRCSLFLFCPIAQHGNHGSDETALSPAEKLSLTISFGAERKSFPSKTCLVLPNIH